MSRMYVAAESPNEGACFKYMMEPESPHEGVCLRYLMKQSRRMMGRV